MSNIKDFIIGAFMSLSKVEQSQILTQVKRNEDDNNIGQETPVQKKEIKIISNERFNQLLEGADRIYKEKYADKFAEMAKDRGIEKSLISFRNQKFESSLYDQLEGKTDVTYSFNTSNNLNVHCSNMYVADDGDNKVKLFFSLHSESRNRDFSDLEYFYVYDTGTIYTFIELKYLGLINHNNNAIAVFNGAMFKKESERKITQESVMRKEDLFDPRTYKFNG